MATISACLSTSSLPRASVSPKISAVCNPSFIKGLPSLAKTKKVQCSEKETTSPATESILSIFSGSSLIAASAVFSPSAIALVDERLSTEGTGLPFGVSNNLLIWILAGVFALVWALYFVYTAGLEEDEESGLSL